MFQSQCTDVVINLLKCNIEPIWPIDEILTVTANPGQSVSEGYCIEVI